MSTTPHVLIVDDMIVNQKIMASILASQGITSDVADDGESCFALCRENDYDLIFMDQMMPGIEGTETLVYVKQILAQRGETTPVICYTSNDSPEEIAAYRKAGFAATLGKPIDPAELKGVLETYLGDRFTLDLFSEEERIERNKEEYAKLPQWLLAVPGIDASFGIECCGTAADYLEAVAIFFHSIDAKSRDIERFLAEQNASMYTLRVHSLKSVSRMIGARELSLKAAELEKDAKGGKLDELAARTTDFVKEYRAFAKVLSPIDAQDRSPAGGRRVLPPISEATLSDAYMSMYELALIYDRDGVSRVLAALTEYSLSKEDEKRVLAIGQALYQMDWESLRTLLAFCDKRGVYDDQYDFICTG